MKSEVSSLREKLSSSDSRARSLSEEKARAAAEAAAAAADLERTVDNLRSDVARIAAERDEANKSVSTYSTFFPLTGF